jgi:type I restriction-modification system DNA methylase subunit
MHFSAHLLFIANFSNDSDALGDAYEYLIGQFAAGGGKKAGEFYTPQQVSKSITVVRKICNALGDLRNNYAKFFISLRVISTQFFRI